MSSVDVTINGKLYKIGCSEGTVDDIQKYAKELDSRINSLRIENPISFMGLSQETLFLFEALSLISENAEIKEFSHKGLDYKEEIKDLRSKIAQLSETIKNLQEKVREKY